MDAALLWPTYPMLGIDDRNAYDMIRSLPGGIDALRGVVRELHDEGVRVLWPLMPWDTATRYEGPEPDAMLRLLNQTGADGINGDTLYAIPEAFYTGGATEGTHAALQAELGGALHGLKWSTLGWGESGGWSLDLGRSPSHAPQVDLFKWLQPRRMTNICRRWDTNRTEALHHAWFNGVGYVAWENVWGIWNGLTPRDAEALKRMQAVLRYLGGKGLLGSSGWEPHAPTAQPESIFASRFPQAVPTPGAHGACPVPTAWTLVERAAREWLPSSPVLHLKAAAYEGCSFLDLYRGEALTPDPSAGDGDASHLTLRLPIEASGYGAILALPEADAAAALHLRSVYSGQGRRRTAAATDAAEDTEAGELGALLAHQARLVADAPLLASYSAAWEPAQHRPVLAPNAAAAAAATAIVAAAAPDSAAAAAAAAATAGSAGTCAAASPPHVSCPEAAPVQVPPYTAYSYRVEGVVIEPFEEFRRSSFGIDTQFGWEDTPRNGHKGEVDVAGFLIDPAPVGMARYAAYLG